MTYILKFYRVCYDSFLFRTEHDKPLRRMISTRLFLEVLLFRTEWHRLNYASFLVMSIQPVFMETCGIFLAAKHHCAKALPLALISINYLSVRIFSLVWLNNLTFLLLRPAYLQQTILLVRSPILKVNYTEMSQVAFYPSEHLSFKSHLWRFPFGFVWFKETSRFKYELWTLLQSPKC